VTDAFAEQLARALRACADEPISTPGAVQPHGALLALAGPGDRVAVASLNTGELLGVPADALLGRPLAEVWPALGTALADADAEDDPHRRVTLEQGGPPFDLVTHRTGGLRVVELEPLAGAVEPALPADLWSRTVPAAVQRLHDARTLPELAAAIARAVRAMTGFDRVMVYRFDRDWNGEVIAEERRDDLEPFLGLHYPASDIPAQARALYTRQWSRLIPTSDYRPVPLLPDRDPLTGAPLDLSDAALRSVSPVHLQYLRNMGVVASMSVSLVDRGVLWGLISCHHYAGAFRPSHPVRAAAEFLGRTASTLLASRQEEGRYEQRLHTQHVLAGLGAAVGTAREPGEALLDGPTTSAALVGCTGVVVRVGGRLRTAGAVPAGDRLDRLLAALAPRLADGPVVTDSVAALDPGLADLRDVAAGVLAVPLRGGATGDLLAWLRPEVLREVTWGGNPHEAKVVEGAGADVRLTPRHSFAQWSEVVRLTSQPWWPHEAEAAADLARAVSDALLQRVERDSRLAATLRTVLVDPLPPLPGLAVAARYLPSQEVVGGDWYDLVPLTDGRLAVVIGDVAGHGLAVSSVTAQLRHGLRAYLLQAEDAGEALGRLNAMVARLLPAELATAAVAVLDPATASAQVASAGHLPLLHLADGRAEWAGSHLGPALGLTPDARFRTLQLPLADGAGLLLFTDGLVERRGVSLDRRMDLLHDLVLGAGDSDPEGVCDAVLAGLPRGSDDATLLLVKRR
jgi:two-component system, chemotaxis family, sensor kinase Cph1